LDLAAVAAAGEWLLSLCYN